MPGLSPKTGGLSPVLTLDVVDDSGFRPRQESGDHQPHTFAAAGRGESQNMFGAVVPQVVQALACGRPAAHENAVVRGEQAAGADIALLGPAGRTMQVLGVHGEQTRPAVRHRKEDTNGEKASGNQDKHAQ